MRKKTSPHGNVGPTDLGEKKDMKRCNLCNHFNGAGKPRVMRKDKFDPTGGYICSECVASVYQTADPLSLDHDYVDVNDIQGVTTSANHFHDERGTTKRPSLDYYDGYVEADELPEDKY